MMTYTTKNGNEYKLSLKEGSALYGWSGKGQLHSHIKTLFLNKAEAVEAMKFYDMHILESARDKNLFRLSLLKKKEDLLSFAKEVGIEVSKDLKGPQEIKKFIKENY